MNPDGTREVTGWRLRAMRSPRLLARWRRGYNRRARFITDGLTKLGWSRFWSARGGQENRKSWTKFYGEWLAAYERDERGETDPGSR